ncbi:TetR/AcrR family transcriptional regulator [Rhizobium bangladeshense]|uniref:TetR/AcrR family transcriptional regulator n=1 Tax=Rhizobium bangladeshense TaxID=1138189 RepID=UPI001C90BA27|nr:TetR/AcrR family transcriptional regulator [Rhizobium bangladeshense]MBY3597312.1 TetR/AcrR family transcriptional regulator [Rhizobium bangladeshense]
MIDNKRTNNPEGVRRRIIDAAYEAFVTQGYLATGMLELRERASVSGGAMAHHFPAKRDLGLAVISDRVADAVRQTWIEPLHRCVDAPTAIDLIFENVIGELTQKDRVSGCPLNNMAMEVSQHDAEMRALVSAVFAAWHEAMSAKFAADVEGKHAIGFNPQRTATLVIAAYSGAMAMAKARQDVSPLNDCRAELSELLAEKYRRP